MCRLDCIDLFSIEVAFFVIIRKGLKPRFLTRGLKHDFPKKGLKHDSYFYFLQNSYTGYTIHLLVIVVVIVVVQIILIGIVDLVAVKQSFDGHRRIALFDGRGWWDRQVACHGIAQHLQACFPPFLVAQHAFAVTRSVSPTRWHKDVVLHIAVGVEADQYVRAQGQIEGEILFSDPFAFFVVEGVLVFVDFHDDDAVAEIDAHVGPATGTAAIDTLVEPHRDMLEMGCQESLHVLFFGLVVLYKSMLRMEEVEAAETHALQWLFGCVLHTVGCGTSFGNNIEHLFGLVYTAVCGFAID